MIVILAIMAYLDQADDGLINDLLTRKEYYWNKRWKSKREDYADIIPRFMLEDAIGKNKNLRLMSYQAFVSNYINPNTPYQRLYLEWQTGTGKSIGALSIAMNFIKFYRQEQELKRAEIGSVFVIGFSDRVFKNELLRFPEFGFLSRREKKRLDKLREIAATGSHADVERKNDMITKIKKRFGNRKVNGFFKFYGYKAFVNRIFKTKPGVNLNELSEEGIRKAIADGRITYNEELINQFKNSLLICDEIHNVYNSTEKNNWGVAIQAVLDKEPTCRAVFASATPINNQASEIVDLLNLLLPAKERLNKSDFFDKKGKLLPGALEKIAKLSRGRVSFLRDVNPKYYPSVEMHGTELKQISYLRFVRCPMSKFHYNTYKKVYTGTLSQDSQYLVDFVLENPDPNSDIGLYQTNQIKTALINAPQKWKEKIGLDFKDGYIIGDALRREYLGKYSAKYVAVLDQLHKVIKDKKGKVFIYHNIVHMSGVLFIEQVLRKNGFIGEQASSTDSTICMKCGKTKKEHSKRGIVGGSSDDDDSKEIHVTKKGKHYEWMRGEHHMMTIIKDKTNKRYFIPAANLDDTLVKGKSQALRVVGSIINELDNIPVFIQVPNYAPRLGEWLLHLGFKVKRKTSKHIEMELPVQTRGGTEDVMGGRVKSSRRSKKKVVIKRRPKKTKSSKKTKSDTNSDIVFKRKDAKFDHAYVPARYVIAHSDIDKAQMEHSIEKFNSPDNVTGERFMILIGSKIIKESYDIKAIQNVFITGRPDNIPMFLQIRGRAIRKDSHKGLPVANRKVNIYIFTSCLPTKIKSGKDKGQYELSYEEEKYRAKVEVFKTIQKIQKVLHENAIDSVTNRSIILRQSEIEDPLEALPFEPAVANKFKKELPLSKLNTTTFDIYHAMQEIKVIKLLIKRFFIEISPTWEYSDLLKIVREDPFNYNPEVNPHLFEERNFMLALHQLSWNNNPRYVEPLISEYTQITEDPEKITENLINKLHNPNDKVIMLPGGQDSVIVPIPKGKKQFYILFPIDISTNEPNVDIELPYRVMKQEPRGFINMNAFVKNKRIDFDYDDKKKIFYRKYVDISIENMENVVCEYGTNFHIKFLEECVEYVFRVWTDPNVKLHEHHEFYFKMLYYYDLLSLVMWAYTCKPRIFREYSKYANPVKVKDIKLKAMSKYEKRQEELKDISPDDTSDLATSGVINLLKSSINRTSNVWIPSEFRQQFNETVDESLKLFSGKKKKTTTIRKVSAKLLPIGHYISDFPKIFHPEKGWDEDPTYIQHDQEYKENNIIIGYNAKSKTGVHVRFKIRNPIHNIKKHKDSRLIEKGTVCKSKDKTYLKNVAKKLDIILPDKFNVQELCMLIRSKLIRLELKERIKKSKIKYFYFHYEQQLPN